MQLPQRTGLESDKGGGDSLADGEVGRVNLAELAAGAGNLLGRVLKGAVDEGGVAVGIGVGEVRDVAVADGAVEDVGRGLGDVVEDGGVDAEVLGEDVLGGVGDPVVDVEGGAGPVEVAVVEDEEELVLVAEAGDGVGDALGEVPDVAVAELDGLVDAVFVDGGDEDATGVDEAPFSLFPTTDGKCQKPKGRLWQQEGGASYHSMPVELTDGALAEVLLGGGNVVALWKILDDLLTDPAAL